MDPALVNHLVGLVDSMKRADRAHDTKSFHALAYEWLRLTKSGAADLHDMMYRNRMQARPIALDPQKCSKILERLKSGEAEIQSLAGENPRYILYITVRPALNAVAELLMHHPTELCNLEALKSTGILVYRRPRGSEAA